MLTKTKITTVENGSSVCADVVGFDFNNYDAADVAEVRKIWLQYGVLRFREINISDEQHIAFSRHFGKAVIHPKQLQEGAHPTQKEILVIANTTKDGKPTGAMGNSEAGWHTDTWFYERPPAGALLRAVEVPPTGGDTYWLSMYQAYETLPDSLSNAVKGRQIFFQSVYDATGALRLGKEVPKSKDFREWQGIVHPLVRTHGESGRQALYLGDQDAADVGSWIVGMPLDESNDLIAQLWKHACNGEVFTQHWHKGDMVMWDNRCTMHRRDSFSPEFVRIMHRTTTAGERPI
jgi:taurine dioxygenase